MATSLENFSSVNPEAEIQTIRHEISVMGANDYEHGAIDSILKDLREKKISGSEALEKARGVLASKQDYH